MSELQIIKLSDFIRDVGEDSLVCEIAVGKGEFRWKE